jgi:hypothetical protein
MIDCRSIDNALVSILALLLWKQCHLFTTSEMIKVREISVVRDLGLREIVMGWEYWELLGHCFAERNGFFFRFRN